MIAGRLRHIAELHKPSATGDAYSTTTGYELVGTARVSLAPLSGSELHSSMQTNSKLVARVWMRYRSDIKASWRLVIDGTTWEVSSPPMDRRQHKAELEILVKVVE